MHSVARDRHIAQAVKVIEDDAEAFFQYPLVVLFELCLWWRKMRIYRVIDQVEKQSAVFMAIADAVEGLQRANAQIESPLTALAVDIFFAIAGQRANQLDVMASEKVRQILHARFEDHRKI